ncbi:MAG: nucleotidyltransferase domain-containing protein [Methanomicrobiales archaeon]
MLSHTTLKEITQKVIDVAKPRKIILFGSYARGEAEEDSDLDLLIVEDTISNKGKEAIKIRNAIGGVGLGVDILVCAEDELQDWSHIPGSTIYWALREGKVIYEVC